MPVQQPDADHGNPEVASRLEVVTGKNAQAAGVLRENVGDTELRGEVRDTDGLGTTVVLLGVLVPLVPRQVTGERIVFGPHPRQKVAIGSEFVEAVGWNVAQ